MSLYLIISCSNILSECGIIREFLNMTVVKGISAGFIIGNCGKYRIRF